MESILRTLLYEWRSRTLPETLGRDVLLDTSAQIGTNNATVITGFRRTGKTYLLYETMERLLKTYSRDEVVYLNFEDERLVPATKELLTNLIPAIQAVYGRKPKYLFLDELQMIPHWSKWVRRMLDSDFVRLFITGSSSKMSSAELPTELRGRAWEVKVGPLNFNEFLRFKQTSLDFEKLNYVKEERGHWRFLFEEYLIYGALPAVVLTQPEKKMELLQSYFQTVVGMDITERHKVENDLALRTLLKLLLNSTYITGSKLHNNLKSMGIAVGKSTVNHYLAYIESSYFMDQLYIYNQAVINQLQYPRKVYFVDTGFMSALSTKFSKNMGRLLENVLFHKLSGKHEVVHYYKDNSGREVDFVGMDDGKTMALYQVCFNLADPETQDREVRFLVKTGERLKCSNLNLVTVDKPEGYKSPAGVQVILAKDILDQ